MIGIRTTVVFLYAVILGLSVNAFAEIERFKLALDKRTHARNGFGQ